MEGSWTTRVSVAGTVTLGVSQADQRWRVHENFTSTGSLADGFQSVPFKNVWAGTSGFNATPSRDDDLGSNWDVFGFQFNWLDSIAVFNVLADFQQSQVVKEVSVFLVNNNFFNVVFGSSGFAVDRSDID